MKRKLFFFTMGSLLFGFTLFIPYWTGVEAEKQFRLLNQRYPSHDARVILSESHYQRGWLTSQAQSTFEVAENILSPQSQQVVLNHKIEHGFLPIYPTVIYTTLAPQNPLVQWLGLSESPLLLKTTLQFDGSGQSQLRTVPLSLHDPDKPAKLQLHAIEGQVNFTANLAQLTGELQLPLVELETDKGSVQFNKTQFTTNLRAHSDDLWLGLSQWQVAEVKLLSRTFPAVTVSEMRLSVDNQLIDKHLQMNFQSQLQQVAVQQDHYGPGDMTVEIRHLDVGSINHVRQILNTMSNLSSGQTNILLWGKLTQHGMALLNEQPELAIPRLNFSTPDGVLTGNLLLGVDKIAAMAWLYPVTLLESFHGELAVQLPKSLLLQIVATAIQPATVASQDETQTVQTWMANWLKRGWIIQQDETYRVQARWQQGLLDLNGKQILLKNLLR